MTLIQDEYLDIRAAVPLRERAIAAHDKGLIFPNRLRVGSRNFILCKGIVVAVMEMQAHD